MKERQLPMMNVLNGGYIFTIFVYWIIPYMFLPSLRPFLGHGFWNNLASLGWIDLICCAINGGALILILKEHLQDTWFDVTVAPKDYIRATLDAWMLMLLWVLFLMIGSHFLFAELSLPRNFFPISEFTMNMVPGLLLADHPIVTTVVFTLFSPFAVGGMFYAVGFAPLASRKPWLGYLNIVIVLLLTMFIKIFWYKDTLFTVLEFIIQLPVHLIACWTYQRTDNLWTPIFSIGLMNLTVSLLFLLISYLTGSTVIAA